MAVRVTMPQLSDTMEKGLIVQWKVDEGAEVSTGDVLAEVETDKASMEVEAFDDGVLLKKLASAGSEVPTQEPMAIIGEPDEDISELVAEIESEQAAGEFGAAKTSESQESEQEPESEEAGEDDGSGEESREPSSEELRESGEADAKEVSSTQSEPELRISPVARKMARKYNLNLARVQASGSGGRIVKADVEQALESGFGRAGQKGLQTGSSFVFDRPGLKSEKIHLSGMRRTIAERMSQSRREIPHFDLNVVVDAASLVDLRQQIDEPELSYNDFLLAATARTLLDHPRLNSKYEDDYLQVFDSVDLAFAVAVEDGLYTPVVERAEERTVFEIHRRVSELAEKARSGTLQPDDYQGGTFTVSNLGMYGVDSFSAIINPPQAAVLAAGAVREKPVVEAGECVPGHRMKLTLTCDHRVVDGAGAAKFLDDLRARLEKPVTLL